MQNSRTRRQIKKTQKPNKSKQSHTNQESTKRTKQANKNTTKQKSHAINTDPNKSRRGNKQTTQAEENSEGRKCKTDRTRRQIKKTQRPNNKNRRRQIKKTQDELQWIVAQRLLSALTIPGFS